MATGFDALAQAGVQNSLAQSQQRRQIADEERQLKAKDLIDTRNGILTKLPTLLGPNGEKTPEYDAAFQQLTQAQQGLGQLYHPDKAPGALQKDWHFLLEKMHGLVTPKGKNTPQPAQATAAAQGAPAAPQVTPAPPAYQPTMGTGASTPAALPSVTPETGGMQIPNTPGFGPTSPGVPKGATEFMAVAKPQGLVESGNIPIWNRPSVLNDDGTHSSELSISMQDDKGNQVLIPLIVGGKFLTPDGKMPPGSIPHNAQEWEKASPEWKALKMRAWQHYEKTGQHLGKFGGGNAADDVDAYAQVLHNRGSATAQDNTPPAAAPTKAPSWGQVQVLKQKAASMQKAQQEAALLASGAGLSPAQQAMSDYNSSQAVLQKKIEDTLVTAKKLGFSDEEMTELKRQMLNLKPAAFKPLTGAAGQPQLGPDGKTFVQYGSDADGNVVARPVGAGYKPNTKAIRGTIVNTKSNGWIQTWVDPYNPSKVIGYQKVAPGTRYTGSTSSSSSTDPFDLTTTTSRSTTPTSGSTPVDFDLSGIQQLPENFTGDAIPESSTPVPVRQTPPSAPSGSPNKSAVPTAAPPVSVSHTRAGVPQAQPSKKAATPSQLKSQVPAPPVASPSAPQGTLPLDSTGHIPADAPYNKQLVGAANDLLDGKDLDKLPIPLKAKEAAETIARQYGWAGQGLFNPQQKLQIREASTFLNDAMTNPSLSVLDSWPSRQKLIAILNNAEGHPGYIDAFLARNTNLNPKEAEFLRMFRQLTGTISGLASLTRPGRPTEAGIKRLMAELPNPNESHSAKDGQERLKRLIKEITIATQKGNADNLFGGAPTAGDGGMSLDDFIKKHNIPQVQR